MDVARRFREIDAVAEPWDRLADDLGAPPFLRPGWTRAWLEAFAPRDFVVCTMWRDERLVALAPLLMNRYSVSSATNDHSPLWSILAVDRSAADALLRAVLGHHPHKVTFEWLDMESPAATAAVETIQAMGYRPQIEERMRSPYSDVRPPWEQFEQRLSKRRRSQLRRYARRLEDEGKITYETRDGTADLDALLAEGYRVEASGWKGREGTAISSQPATRTFYTSVARWAAERGWLRLAYLRRDDRAIAFEYLLACDATTYYVKAGYDEANGRWSPSTILARHTLQTVVADSTQCFEWLGHDDPYKLEWSDGVHERVTTTWFAPTPIGTVRRAAASLSRWATAEARRVVLARLSPTSLQRLKAVRTDVRRVLEAGRRRAGRPGRS